MKIKKNYQHLIFDFDGVILDSTKLKFESFVQLAKKYGLQQIEKFEKALTLPDLMGKGRRKVAQWLEQNGTSLKIDDFEKNFAKMLQEGEKNLKIEQSTIDLFSYLNSKNIPCYICSAAPAEEIKSTLEKFALPKSTFKAIYGIEKGPKAEALGILAKHHNINFKDAIFFGDMPSDLESANIFAIKFIRIMSYWGNKAHWEKNDLKIFLNISEAIQFLEI